MLFTPVPGNATGGSHGRLDGFCGSSGGDLYVVCGGADTSVDRLGSADAADAEAGGGIGDGGGGERGAKESCWAIAFAAGTEERGVRLFQC
jgi:hypothetical protein